MKFTRFVRGGTISIILAGDCKKVYKLGKKLAHFILQSPMFRNQLVTDDKIRARIEKYEHLI